MMRTKPIIIFSNYDDVKNPYYGGGGAVAVHEVAQRLSGAYEVTVITGAYPGAANITRDGVRYKRIGWGAWGGRVGQLIYSILLPWYALRLKYNVWIESFTPPFTASLLPLVTQKPVVGLVHFLPGADMWKRYKVPLHLTEPSVLKLYTHIIALTPAVRETIRSHSPRAQVYVIGNGATVHKNLGKPLLPGTIGFIGRIDVQQKGLDLLFDAFTVAAKQSNVRLRIAGEGSRAHVRKLAALIASSPYKDRIERIGRVSGDGKDQFYRSISCLVVPSRTETMSLAALEAMSYGIPVVGFDIPGLAWIPSECGFRAPAFSVSELGNGMVSVTHNTAAYAAMAAACQAFAATKDWDTVANDYQRVVRSVLSPV